jgi:hypothetical protein
MECKPAHTRITSLAAMPNIKQPIVSPASPGWRPLLLRVMQLSDALLRIVSVGGDLVTNSGKQPRSKSCIGNIDRNRKIKTSQNEPSR